MIILLPVPYPCPGSQRRWRLSYLQDCYPRYVASVLAGNDFFRATLGAAFPLFSTGVHLHTDLILFSAFQLM